MRLSLVVGSYNMGREIPRSVLTMSPAFQQVPADQYEIIVVDNGSSPRLDEVELHAIAENLRYVYVEDASPSPTTAMNAAVEASTGDLITVVIDGARMFSPGVLANSMRALESFDDAFAYVPSLHLGPQLQNDSAVGGYNQEVEDRLLDSVDWRGDGYQLFDISNIEAVPERLAKPTFESNCFTVRRSTWDRVGGYHQGFSQSTGGGLANWELFARYMSDDAITPVLLVGEATFHQFHGGASTNQPRAGHPVRGWLEEHRQIFGTPYAWPVYQPVLFGQARDAFVSTLYERNVHAHISLLHELSLADDHDAAIAIGRRICDRFPNDPVKLQMLAGILDRSSRRAEAFATIGRAIDIAPTQAELYVTCGIIEVGRGRYEAARASYDRSIELDDLLAEGYFHRGHLSLREQHIGEAIRDFERAIAAIPDPPTHYHTDLAGARARAGAPSDPATPDRATPSASEATDIAALNAEFVDSVRGRYRSVHAMDQIDQHARDGSFVAADLAALDRLVRDSDPTRVLVIGAFLGLSTRLIAAATKASGASIVSIDPNLRHRVFSAPLDHARDFVADDRVQFVDGFFGARTVAGSIYDLCEYEPSLDEASARTLAAEVPTANPSAEFDFVLVDADMGTEAELVEAVLPLLAPRSRLVITRIANKPLAVLVGYRANGALIETVEVPDGQGFATISFSPT